MFTGETVLLTELLTEIDNEWMEQLNGSGTPYDCYLVGKYMFIFASIECYRLDMETKDMIKVDRVVYGEYQKGVFLNGIMKIRYYDGILYVCDKYYDGNSGKSIMATAFVDVEEPKTIQTIQVPHRNWGDRIYWMNGHGKLYYITVDSDEELGYLNIITKEEKVVNKKIGVVPYTIEERGLFKPRYEYEYREPKAYVIGRWLVYKEVQKSWSDNYFQNVGDLRVIDLEGEF